MMRPPFSWLCHQEPLNWLGDHMNSSVISLHAHGPNRPAHDETSYPPTRSLVLFYFAGPPLFLVDKPFVAFSGIPG
jgi:hypothetical protein